VDNYQRTVKEDVYAVGDCASTKGFITGRTDTIMLASTATAEARVLGYNLFCIKVLRHFTGTLSVFSTEINHKAFASAGAIEQTAEEANIKYVVGSFADVDRHPATIADTYPLEVKLIANPENGEIIGGELFGGKGVGEMINIISLAIQKSITVYEFVSFQFGTHPLLTTAPTKYVLVKAAEQAITKIKSCRE
jgi:pyruvate/2-oxoglutarate dehydrogenase complex dihydrolipoamide dehydrogenase (E3) component